MIGELCSARERVKQLPSSTSGPVKRRIAFIYAVYQEFVDASSAVEMNEDWKTCERHGAVGAVYADIIRDLICAVRAP